MIEATAFTPLSAALGGVLIGLAAALLMWGTGRIAGISGIFRGAFSGNGSVAWNWAFLLGLVGGAALAFHVGGFDFSPRHGFPAWQIVLGGLLVGFGTALGSGCTSGHGVCGIARLSPRSVAATLVFMAVGIVTASVLRHGFGA